VATENPKEKLRRNADVVEFAADARSGEQSAARSGERADEDNPERCAFAETEF